MFNIGKLPTCRSKSRVGVANAHYVVAVQGSGTTATQALHCTTVSQLSIWSSQDQHALTAVSGTVKWASSASTALRPPAA